MSLFSDDMRRDPFPVYDQLRAVAPVFPEPRRDLWLILDYDGVKRALNDHDTFSSRYGPEWLGFLAPPRPTKPPPPAPPPPPPPPAAPHQAARPRHARLPPALGRQPGAAHPRAGLRAAGPGGRTRRHGLRHGL